MVDSEIMVKEEVFSASAYPKKLGVFRAIIRNGMGKEKASDTSEEQLSSIGWL